MIDRVEMRPTELRPSLSDTVSTCSLDSLPKKIIFKYTVNSNLPRNLNFKLIPCIILTRGSYFFFELVKTIYFYLLV